MVDAPTCAGRTRPMTAVRNWAMTTTTTTTTTATTSTCWTRRSRLPPPPTPHPSPLLHPTLLVSPSRTPRGASTQRIDPALRPTPRVTTDHCMCIANGRHQAYSSQTVTHSMTHRCYNPPIGTAHRLVSSTASSPPAYGPTAMAYR